MSSTSPKLLIISLLILLSASKLQVQYSSSYLMAYSASYNDITLQYNEHGNHQLLVGPEATVIYEIPSSDFSDISEQSDDYAQVINQTCTGLSNGNLYCMQNADSSNGNMVLINQMDYKEIAIKATYVGNISYGSFQASGNAIIISSSSSGFANFMVYDATSNSNVCNKQEGNSYTNAIYNNGYVILSPGTCDSGSCILSNYSCSQQTSTQSNLDYNQTVFTSGFTTNTLILGSGANAVAVVFSTASELNGDTYYPTAGYGAYIISNNVVTFDPTIGIYTNIAQVSPSNIIVVNTDFVLTQYQFNFTTNTFQATSLPTLTIPLINTINFNGFNSTSTLLVESWANGYSNYYVDATTMTITNDVYEGTYMTFANGSVVDVSRYYEGYYSIYTSGSFYSYVPVPNHAFTTYQAEYVSNAFYMMEFDASQYTGCNLIGFIWASNQIVNVTLPGCNFSWSKTLLAVASANNVYYVVFTSGVQIYLFNSSGLVGQQSQIESGKPTIFIDTANNLLWWYDTSVTNVYGLNNFSLINTTNYPTNFQQIYKVSDTYAIGVSINQSNTQGIFSVIAGTSMTIVKNFTWPFTGTLTSSGFSMQPLLWSSNMQSLDVLMFEYDNNFNIMDSEGNTYQQSLSGWVLPISTSAYSLCTYLPQGSNFMGKCAVYNLPGGDDEDEGGIGVVGVAAIVIVTIGALAAAVYCVMKSRAAKVSTKIPTLTQGIVLNEV